MKLTPKTGAAALAVVLLLAGGVYYFVRPEPPLTEKPPTDTSSQILVMENNKLVEKKDGRLVWELEAKRILLEKATGQATLEGVQAILYREDGSKLTLQAQTGTLDNTNKSFRLTGGVAAAADDGSRLAADAIAWQQATALITASGKVRLEKADLVATANEAQTDRSFDKLRLTGNAVIVKGGK